MMKTAVGIDLDLVTTMHRLSKVASVGLIVLGLTVLIGWTIDVPELKSIDPSFAEMKANTALLFVLLGGSLLSSGADAAVPVRRGVPLVIVGVAAATLTEYVLGVRLGIDELLFSDAASTLNPGRMAPVTAANFLLLGSALLFLDIWDRRISDAAVLLVFVSSFVSLCGYLYGVTALYKVGPYVSIALHTTLGFLIAGVAFFAVRPAEGIAAAFAYDTSGGTILRRALPLVIFIPLLLGWLRLLGQSAGLYDTTFGIAIHVATNAGLLGTAIALVASSLHRSELRRRQADQLTEKSEQRLRRLIEGSPYAVAMLDRNMCYLFASGRWLSEYRLTFTKDEIRGRSHYDVFPQTPDRWKQIHRRCLAGETLTGDAEAFTRNDGVVDWIRWDIRPWLDDDGDVGGILIFTENVNEKKRAEDQSKHATELFRLAIEAAPTGMLMIDRAGTIALVNAQTEKLFGYSRGELLHASIEMLVPEDSQACHPAHRAAFFRDPAARPMGAGRELSGRRKDRTEVPIEIGLNPLQTSEGHFVLASIVDISERKQVERQRAELAVQREAAARHQERSRFFELSLDLVCIANTSGRFVQLNPSFASTLGYSIEELSAAPFLDFVHPDDIAATQREVEKLARGVATVDFTNRYRCKDGSFRWLQWRTIPDETGTLYAIARDVSKDRALLESLQNKQASLSASLKEREVLLQEVHHRVKNNLQVIWSLMNIQLSMLDEPRSRVALEECQSRVQAIALIHEQLYQSKDYARVPFSEYVTSLAANIFHASGATRGQVTLELDIESLFLPVDRAIPCGLIINELISNALKHAFPQERSGVVRVALRKATARDLILVVGDDGVGMPAGFSLHQTHSLGMVLVATLAEQLDGQLEIVQERGTTFRVQFPAEAA